MRVHHLFLLLLFCASTAWADFSDSLFRMHPAEPKSDPFVLEITGDWPTDCHPGEQKPVISEYTGDTVLIEFETIVEHVTCNEIATPFRVLVDMSDVIDGEEDSSVELFTTIRFGGEEFTTKLSLVCICSPTPRGPDIKPESGLYDSQGLEKQGLLVARQTDRMAVYPLIYDDTGSSEWLFGAGGIVEDVFFSDLNELTGGQCLGCAPPDDTPQLNVVGKITMLMDSEGVTQVKVNDGLFVSYEQSEFGYGSLDVGGHPNRHIPDFSGRWAFVDYMGSQDAPSGYPVLPEIFDIRLEAVEYSLLPIIAGTLPPVPPGYALFSISDTAGNKTAQIQCGFIYAEGDVTQVELICDVSNADIANGEKLYQVKAPSIERLGFVFWGPTLPDTPVDGRPAHTAVRIDELK